MPTAINSFLSVIIAIVSPLLISESSLDIPGTFSEAPWQMVFIVESSTQIFLR